MTIIYSIRDRSLKRLSDSIKSVKMHNNSGIVIDFLVVDYGSKNKEELKNLSNAEGFRLIRTETEGLPWSRAKALNIGVKSCKSEVFVTTDIDMIFEFDVAREVFQNLNKNEKLHCLPQWIPKSGSKQQAIQGDTSSLGGFMAMFKEDFISLNGFNEEIYFWGSEDNEFDLRSSRMGITKRWINSQNKMYHVWHPVSHGFFDSRPEVVIWKHSFLKLKAHLSSPSINHDGTIGTILSLTDRPIISLLKSNLEIQELDVSKKELIFRNETLFFKEINEKLKSGNLFFIKTGDGKDGQLCKNEKLNSLIIYMISLFNKVFKGYNLEIKYKSKKANSIIMLLIQEFAGNIISDYYWEFNKGIYILPSKSNIQ